MPRAQAEAVAQGLAAMMLHNLDALVTKDYLDARFEGLDGRFEAIDARFEAIDARFEAVDARFDGIDARFRELEERLLLEMDKRFIEAALADDQRFAAIDVRFVRVNVLQGVILVAVAIPLVQSALAWFVGVG